MRGSPSLRIAFAAMLTLSTLFLAFGARAEDPEPLTKEPERYAFIAGVANYTGNGSSFEDLLTACDEAIRFRAMLIGAGWAPDHIFPRVAIPPGQSEVQGIQAAVCDAKTADLRAGLKAFSDRLLDAEGNPFGVVYLSGHGAQSNGEQYFFGADANIDFAKELRRAQISPLYKVFSEDGVDVLDTLKQLSGINSRAVLVIMDACRNNAALERYKDILTRAGSANPRLLTRLSADYLSARGEIEDYDGIFSNIVVLFSTRPEQEAAGAPAGSTTDFSRRVFDSLRDDEILRASGLTFAEEIIHRSKLEQAALPRWQKQIPQKIGSMGVKPVFCFKGCPQPLAAWPSEEVTTVAMAPAPAVVQGHVAAKSAVVRQTAAYRPAANAPTILKAAYAAPLDVAAAPPAGTMTAAAAPAPPPPDAEALVAAAREAVVPLALRSMNVDVFYCLGDAGLSDRQSEARRFAESLRSAIPADAVIDGYYLDRIRLRSFDPAANPQMAQGKSGASIWIDYNSRLERDWAERMAGAYSGRIPIRTTVTTRTKDYISAFFCGDLQRLAPTSTVYTQVSRRADVPRVARLVADLQKALPTVRVERAVDPVDDRLPGKIHTPNATEVRYYQDDQKAAVDSIVSFLNARLSLPAKAVKFKRAERLANPVIEVWVGLDETATWTTPAPAPAGAPT